jgi:hypothetical protein
MQAPYLTSGRGVVTGTGLLFFGDAWLFLDKFTRCEKQQQQAVQDIILIEDENLEGVFAFVALRYFRRQLPGEEI